MKIGFFLIAFGFIFLMTFYVSLRGWQTLQVVGNMSSWYLVCQYYFIFSYAWRVNIRRIDVSSCS